MEIKSSQHIKTRLTLRGIDYALPKIVYENAQERFLDTERGHFIALMKTMIYGKEEI